MSERRAASIPRRREAPARCHQSSLLVLLLALGGCESAADKCARLQRESAAAWGAYAAELEAGSGRARSAHEAARVKAGALEQRLLDAARKQADGLYEPRSSAWWRAFDAAQQTLCSKDPQCMELKTDMAQADQTGKELSARLSPVRAAQSAASAAASDPGRANDAEQAAGAVEDDFDRPQLKPARAASKAAQEACAGVAR